jgi:UDP-N-acetylglucosamine:LPS N-acetylglucosamine transferase
MCFQKKILYVSGSIGLGHVTRDLAIAGQIRKQCPEAEISWLACHPASALLEEAGENLLPETGLYANTNIHAEKTSKGFEMSTLKYALNENKILFHNVKIYNKIFKKEKFDLVISDEAYDLIAALMVKFVRLKAPFVMIYDFLGMDPLTKNPFEKLIANLSNCLWRKWDTKLFSNPKNLALFAGTPQDIPDKRLGFITSRRDHAKQFYNFTGYVLPFDPSQYIDKTKIRTKLGYGPQPLVICAIGGTSIGKNLLELCSLAYPIIKQKIPDLRMVLVCGPRLATGKLKVPQEIEVKDYVPALYEHFAASDLAIVQAGGATTIELTALNKPFLYFPLAKHCEQLMHVAKRLARQNAGIKMQYSKTTPQILANSVIANIGKKPNYPPVPTTGAQTAAQLISKLI